MNQTFSRFSLTIQGAANNAERCSKAPKETPHRIKAPPLCATHLKKVDENSNLLTALVSASAGETFLLLDATVGAAARKVPSFKALRGNTAIPNRGEIKKMQKRRKSSRRRTSVRQRRFSAVEKADNHSFGEIR